MEWSEVDRYFAELLIPSDPDLEAALAANLAAGLPAQDVSPSQGRLLQLLATVQGARRILEIGTLGGYSTIWLARALPHDGVLVTLKRDPKHAAVARENLARAGLGACVDVRVGVAGETLEALAREGAAPFDYVFLDADKAENPRYLELSLPLLRAGSLIVADNVVRDGAVARADSEDPRVRGVRAFTEALGRDPRIEATAIQTVGAKGWDGFILARVAGSLVRSVP